MPFTHSFFQLTWFQQALRFGCLVVLSTMLSFAYTPFTASAQYNRFQQPVWHPSQNIIAVSNGVSVRLYSSDFFQVLNEFELTPIRNSFIQTTAVVWSPDGTMLAVSIQGSDIIPSLQIWGVGMGRLIALIEGISPIATFAWSPQSTHIAVSYERGLGDVTLRIYDLLNMNTIQDYDIVSQLGYITNIRWSPNGRQIAINIRDMLYLLELPSGQVRKSNNRMYADFESPRFVFSPDSRYLAGITEIDAISVRILDTSTDQIIGTLVGHTDRILGINWIEGHIVTVGLDGITRLWNPVTFDQITAFQTGVTSQPSFSSDASAFVASANDFQTILVRDTSTGAIIASLDPIESTPATVTLAESDGSTSVTESGATDTYTLTLGTQPTADVIVSVTGTDQLTVSPSSLTFTPENWDVPQNVIVSAVDDSVVEGDHTAVITYSASSTDAGYNGISVADVTVPIADNDSAGVTITELDGDTAVVEDGATDTYTVALTSQPIADVVITASVSSQATVNPSPRKTCIASSPITCPSLRWFWVPGHAAY